jgi:hypothetical protein
MVVGAWFEGADSMSEDPPPQFGLRTMLMGVAVFALLCGIVAWCGLTGWRGVLMLVLIPGASAGAFIGLLICAYSGLGFGFGDLKWDIVKCLALGVIVVLLAYGLISLSPVPQILFVMPVVMFVCLKLFWMDLEGVEIVIVGCTLLCAIAVTAGIVQDLIGGWAKFGGL